jgi:tripartite-type tricarboxylate transporter receptor subunit TctC
MFELHVPRIFRGLLLGAAALSGLSSAQAQTPDFYTGKTIDLVIGYSAGGGYDAYARLIARHLGNHLPGKPTIVPRNMPGGGGRVVGGFMANVAPKDGTVLAMADQSLPLQQAMADPTVRFDTSRFAWIGTPIADNNTLVTWHTSGITTVDQAREKSIVVGATGENTSAQYPRAMNVLLGTRFKVIIGYPGGNDINLAMERGEVGGRGSNNWPSWKSTRPDWLRDKKINILVQIGLKRDSELPDVPLLFELAKTDEDRAALRLLSAPVAIGRPIFTTPGVPKERVEMLRRAFDETMKDAAFLADAQKSNLDIAPSTGEELQAVVAEILATPKSAAERLAKAIAPETGDDASGAKK